MTEHDVIDRLGEPDKVLPPGGGMRSTAWRCSACKVTLHFDAPVRPPAPCGGCGSVFFEKAARVDH
jgi:hypothetical protein